MHISAALLGEARSAVETMQISPGMSNPIMSNPIMPNKMWDCPKVSNYSVNKCLIGVNFS